MARRTPRHNMSTVKCNSCPARWMINRDNWVAGNKFFKVNDGVFIHGTSLWDSESVNQVPESSRVQVCHHLSRLQEPEVCLIVSCSNGWLSPTDIDQRIDGDNRADAV